MTSSDLHRQADELVRYYGELERRVIQAGVRGIGELLTLYERLRAALGAVGAQEIGWVAEQTEGLLQALVRMDDNLQALRRLKAALGQGSESARGVRDRRARQGGRRVPAPRAAAPPRSRALYPRGLRARRGRLLGRAHPPARRA